MGRYIGPVCRLCRREKTKLYLKSFRCYGSKCPLEKSFTIPGMHGPKKKPKEKLSDYNLHLREKQRVKRIYGMFENQFRAAFEEARLQREIPTGEKLLELLERRLDNVVFRSALAPSRSVARQLVSHGHVLINGKKISVPSHTIRQGDEVTLDTTAKKIPLVSDSVKAHLSVPNWISLDSNNFQVKITRNPTRADIDTQANVQLIVEFYSK